MSRVLDLDSDDSIQITLAGREFTLRQQRRAIIERVVRAVQAVEEQTFAKTEAERQRTPDEELGTVFSNWDQALPTYALMLGHEPGDVDYADVLNYLEWHLTFPKAQVIFNAWYDLNQVRRFFIYLGNPLIPQREFDQAVEAAQVRLNAQAAAEIETAATPASVN